MEQYSQDSKVYKVLSEACPVVLQRMLHNFKLMIIKIAYKCYRKSAKDVKKIMIFSKPLKKYLSTKLESKACVFTAVLCTKSKQLDGEKIQKKESRSIDLEHF